MSKKDDKTTIWTLIPNQYEWTIYLCLSKKPYDKLIPLFNKKYGLDFDKEYILQFIGNDNNDCTLFNENSNVAIIVLRNYNQSSNDYATIAHEIYHVASFIAQQLQIPMDYESTTEVWAYFISFYMNVIIQTLDEYLNDKKKKS